MLRHNIVSTLTTQIYDHPFNQQLNDGSLPHKTFTFFLEQDILYLKDYSLALYAIAKRLDGKDADQFYLFAKEAHDEAINLHHTYLDNNHSPRLFHPKKTSNEKIPVIADYTHHLLAHAAHSPIEVAIASVTPCYWLYSQLGQKMQASPDNPYHCWITAYSHPEFTASANVMMNILEELMEKNPVIQDEVVAAFVKSTEYELQFFNCVCTEAFCTESDSLSSTLFVEERVRERRHIF